MIGEVDIRNSITQRGQIIAVILCLALSVPALKGQYYGLQFSGHEVPLNERTELYLTPNKPLNFKNELELNFDFRFQPNSISYYGYIYRILIGTKSIDFIHGFLPDTPKNFQLVFNDSPSSISFNLPIEKLTSEWTKIQFNINLKAGTISCNLGDTILTDQIQGYSAKEGVQLFFGAHQHDNFTTTDVTQMNIRNIELKTDNKQYIWPLKQTESEVVYEVNHQKDGLVKNPNWLLSLHTNWKKIANLELSGLAQTAFNQEEDLLYIATSESLFTLNLLDNSIRKEEFTSPYKIVSTNTLVYDSTKNQLISYSIDYNYKSVYDQNSRSWSLFPKDTTRLTYYWHHNNFVHPDGNIYTFGGYGQFNYKNLVLRLAPGASGFDTVTYQGEFFPRYLAAVGYAQNNDKLYILGGYGSKSGQQTLSPAYFHELLEYSFEESRFSRIYEISDSDYEFCFANSAVIHDNQLYALAFSKYHFENKLQLIHINLDSPSIERLGSPVDFKFIDIESDVELYFSKGSNKLIAISSYLNGEKSSVDIYSISFPPQKPSRNLALNSIKKMPGKMNYYLLIVIIILLFAGIIIMYFVSRRKGKQTAGLIKGKGIIADVSKYEIKHNEPVKSSIILFGGFQVIDKDGNDITGSFTQLLKSLLLFIMLNSIRHKKGVSSQIISETFWFDKSVESARNNRAVNIVKIKSLLEKVGNASISKDTGYWKFEYDPKTMDIDYANYLDIVGKGSELTRDDICNLLEIIDRGQFLVNTEADWLDVYKSEVSNKIIDSLADFIETSDSEEDFILHLTNCMFMFDIASEEAMILQCRTLFKLGKHSLAKKSYARFVKEYKNLYDEEYKRSFNSILETGEQKKG
ncbi:MAG: hypothetical protein WD052_08595 [Bacteroidales bacterium]